METNDLRPVVAIGTLVSTQPDNALVIAAGPLFHQPHSRPSRVVIVDWGDKFSVHEQIFQIDEDVPDLAVACLKAKSYLHDGNYTPDIIRATELFIERITRRIENENYQTIFRRLPTSVN